MNALVTGGTGTVGRLTVARLLRGGHRVRVIGVEEDADVGDAEYHQCDITDFASVREQVRGMEGVVHLAAIPHPSRRAVPY
jgi:nucleoside-diphosphate-sugar epimerase